MYEFRYLKRDLCVRRCRVSMTIHDQSNRNKRNLKLGRR